MTDISALFQRDPLNLTKEEIDEIISFYRQARANFNLGDKQAGSAKRLEPGPKIEKIDIGEL